MVTLDNIVKQNNIFEYDYYTAENPEDGGHVIYNAETKQTEHVDYCVKDRKYKGLHIYYAHSLMGLEHVIDAEDVPSKYVFIWN